MARIIFSLFEKFSHHPRLHEWSVSINMDNAFKNVLGADAKQILDNIGLLAETSKLPGIANSAISQFVKGAPFRIPQRSNKSGDLSMIFKEAIVSNAYRVHRTITDWIDRIDSAETGVGYPTNQTRCDLTLSLYKPLDSNATTFESIRLFSVVFKKAYPRIVGAVPLTTTNPTTIIKIPVTWRYEWWEVVR